MLGTQAAGGLQGGVHPCLSPPGWGAESWAGPADPMAGQSSRVYSFLDYIMGGCQIHFTVSPRVRHAASRHTPPPTRSAPPPCPGCGSALVWQPGQRSRQTWGQRHPSAGPGGPSPPARLFLGLSLGSCSVQGAGTLGRAVARTDPPQKHSDGGGGDVREDVGGMDSQGPHEGQPWCSWAENLGSFCPRSDPDSPEGCGPVGAGLAPQGGWQGQ